MYGILRTSSLLNVSMCQEGGTAQFHRERSSFTQDPADLALSILPVAVCLYPKNIPCNKSAVGSQFFSRVL